MRKTVRQLAGIVRAALVADANTDISYIAGAKAGDKSLKLDLFVIVGATQYEVASDSGKLRVFGTLDDCIKVAAKVHEANDGQYSVTVATADLLASPAPANIGDYLAAQIAKLGKVKAAQTDKSAALADQLAAMAGWDSGNAAQVARFNEVTAQKVAVDGDIVAIDAEVVRLTALIPGA